MRRQTRTWVAFGAALVLGAGAGAGAARADERQKAKTAAQERAGGAATATEASSKEMSGRVLQASPSKLFLEHMGAVVEFNIASDAQFSGGGVQRSTDLAEGQEVRASFTVENKTTNVAKRISVSGRTGGTGTSGQAPEQRPSTPGEPMTPGTPAPHEPSTTPSPR